MKDTAKALQLANLPEFYARFDRRLESKQVRSIVQVVHSDFTQKDANGKRPLRSTTYKIVETISPFSAYGLNFMALHRNEFGQGVDEENIADDGTFTLTRPRKTATVEVGPFAGKTYWYPEREVKGYPTDDGGYNLEFTYNLFQNTTKDGNPEPTNGANPLYSLAKEEYSTLQPITKGGANRVTKPVRTNITMTQEALLAATGYSFEQFKYATRTTYHFSNKPEQADDEKLILNHFVDVQVNNGVFTPTVYFNGIPANVIDYRKLQTSYGQNHPSYVFRWRLYNEGYPKDSIWGSAWYKEYRKSNATPADIEDQDLSINVVLGTTVLYDQATNTLTVDATKDCRLWASWEEYPAQGKNDGGEQIIDLRNFVKCVDSSCLITKPV